MSTMLTFYNCTMTAIKKKSRKTWLQNVYSRSYLHLSKVAFNFDRGYISLCQLKVYSFCCKIRVNILLICMHYLTLKCCRFTSEINYSSDNISRCSHHMLK